MQRDSKDRNIAERYASRRHFLAGVLLTLIATLVNPVLGPAQTRLPAQFDEIDTEAVEAFGHQAFRQAYRNWHAGQYSEMLALVAPRAEQGDPLAQFLMGSFHSTGMGVPQDDERAALWWRKAAEQGFARAQNEIGVALTDGRGVAADPEQAVVWYRKAADQGLAVAQCNLGLMYWNGYGVRKDQKQAIALYRKAAEQGLGWAQFFLGNAYAAGRGVKKDQSKAIAWFRMAAEQDYTDAQSALGDVYFQGAGIRRDYSRAAYWSARAARRGHESAQWILQNALQLLPLIRIEDVTEVREKPDVAAPVVKTAGEGEYAYELARHADWVEVYFKDGHTVGYIAAAH